MGTVKAAYWNRMVENLTRRGIQVVEKIPAPQEINVQKAGNKMDFTWNKTERLYNPGKDEVIYVINIFTKDANTVSHASEKAID